MSKRWALYHDFDELKCETVREAIKVRAITDGEVICGDIKELTAEHVRGFRRFHAFCGGAFWDLALNLAGWGDGEVWTGSCPCPSFSAAGKGQGFADPRHLWPYWARLIAECRPATVFGEQVAAAIGHGWLDLVQTDLEAQDYAVGKAVLGACSVGAPHIRQRLYFCADAEHDGHPAADGLRATIESPIEAGAHDERKSEGSGDSGFSADPDGWQPSDGDVQRSGQHGLFAQDRGTGSSSESMHSERRSINEHGSDGRNGQDGGRQETRSDSGTCCEVCDRSDPSSEGLQERFSDGGVSRAAVGPKPRQASERPSDFGPMRPWRGPGWLDPRQARSVAEAGATRGFWDDCDWWYGKDGKFRPIGPSLQPLAHGSPARVGRLRLYGDAICVPAAAEFIRAYIEAKGIV